MLTRPVRHEAKAEATYYTRLRPRLRTKNFSRPRPRPQCTRPRPRLDTLENIKTKNYKVARKHDAKNIYLPVVQFHTS